MKKIFAIALAMVMVLSMASAFALSDCATVNFAWTCPAEYSWCGKAVVEVVPYVHTNAACDGDEYVVSDCATAIKGEFVYFAVKMTVDAFPMEKWFTDLGAVTLETAGLDYAEETALTFDGVDMAAKKEKVYYLLNDTSAWVEAKDAEFTLDGVIFKAEVVKAADAEVCVTIESENDGKDVWTYGDFTVDASGAPEVLVFAKDDEVVALATDDSGKIVAIEATSDKFFAEVVSTFKLNNCAVGTCINDDNIKANFGWDDEQEDCFAWSTKGSAVVDTDCVVAIPKTGDVSVVAYAVMAVVAAAGMLKK